MDAKVVELDGQPPEINASLKKLNSLNLNLGTYNWTRIKKSIYLRIEKQTPLSITICI